MVFGFLIKLLEDESPSSEATVVMNKDSTQISNTGSFNIFYSSEGNDNLKNRRIQYISSQVDKYFNFRRNCAENVGQPLMNLSEEGLFLVGQEYSREAESKLLFKSQKTVVWRQIGSALYILIAESLENLQVATHFLHLFPASIDEYFRRVAICSQPKEFLNRPEEFMVLLQNMLPNGQLRLMSEPYSKFLRRDAELNVQK